jgi:hypothetical protein
LDVALSLLRIYNRNIKNETTGSLLFISMQQFIIIIIFIYCNWANCLCPQERVSSMKGLGKEMPAGS